MNLGCVRVTVMAPETTIIRLVNNLILLGRRIKLGKGNINQLNVAPESNAKKVRLIIGKKRVLSVSHRLEVAFKLLEEINVK